ncbi:MAG: alcohol dehydrogenase catalytic domain-containing protein [Verrucomicrobia bacterium]|nr:alcohol dehydrogenase catalytic domain-containing protein [Verrucomicrobiota bacterium]
MKQAFLTAPGRFEVVEVPEPGPIGSHEALIRLEAIGVCGSDVHYFTKGRIGSQVVEYPFTIGHECSGVVERVGEAVTRVAAGDRVTVDPAMPCGECEWCRRGRENICANLRFLGCPGQAEGAYRELLVMPEQSLFRLPDSLSFDDGVALEPAAICTYAVAQSRLASGETIAVLGCGPIGLLVLAAAKASGRARAFATDLVRERVEAARKFGADAAYNAHETDVVAAILDATGGRGVDVVYECAGEQQTLDQAMQLAAPGGRVSIIGIPSTARVELTADLARRKELLLINVRRQNKMVERTIERAASGALHIGGLVTHHFRLDQIAEAFDLVARYRDGVLKAVIRPRG